MKAEPKTNTRNTHGWSNRQRLLFIGILALIVAGAWAFWQYLIHPPRPWIVRWQITRHLKSQGVSGGFAVDFAFPTKAEMAKAPPKRAAQPAFDKGPRTGKSFDVLTREYVEQKISALELERRVAGSQAELENARQRLTRLQGLLAEAKTGGATNLAVAEAQISALQKRIAALEQRASPSAAAEWQKKEESLAPIEADLWAFQRLWNEEVQAAVGSGLGKLNEESSRFAETIRRQLEEAPGYAAMYKAIGQQLWVAHRLLGSANPDFRRVGLSLAQAASRNALSSTVDNWLAARICEGYIWPNLDAADASNRRSPYNLENLLNECANVFRRSEEYPQVVRNYELLLARATTPQQADLAHAEIGAAWEQAGELKKALYHLKQIRATNDYRRTLWRVPRLEQQLKASR